MEPLVYVTRGELLESAHYGEVAVTDTDGNLVASLGDPRRLIYWRSSAKPIQALAVIQSGAADQFELSQPEIAIACGSHYGSAAHVATVRSLLSAADLDESALQCGTHPPADPEERDRLVRDGLPPLPVHNNCSGKHAGMLAATMALGADPSSYLDPQSPVQQLSLRNMSALSGVPIDEIIIATDGCGAPIHGMSIQSMATAFARLAWPDEMPEEISHAAGRIGLAMSAAPVMVSGVGSFNTELLAAGKGRVIAKGGAEGLFVMGLADRGLGIAFRTIDGSNRGQASVAIRLLQQLDALPADMGEALWRFTEETVLNCRREAVGAIAAADFDLAFV